MTWLFPSIVATLIGSLLLGAVYLYLHRVYRDRYLALWAAAWGVYAVRFVAALGMLRWGPDPLLLFTNQGSSLANALLLYAGTTIFLGRPPRRWSLWAGAAGLAWIAAGAWGRWPFLVLTLPIFGFMAAVYVWLGIQILRVESSAGARVAGGAFILWGLHKANYPVLRPVAAFAPWGFLLAATLSFVTALGILLLYFERTRRELAASEARYRELVHHIRSGVAVYETADGEAFRFRDLNEAGARIGGTTPAEAIGREVREVFPGVEKFGILEIFREVWRTGRPERRPLARYEDDRLSVWVDNYVYKLPSGEIVAVYEDVTEARQAKLDLEWEVEVNGALAEMAHALIDPGLEIRDAARLVLRYARQLTGSEHGLVSEIDPGTGESVAHALTDMRPGECDLPADAAHVALPRGDDGRYPGLWGHALEQDQGFFSNDPDRHCAAAGLPEGHVPLRRFLAVPVRFGEEPAGVIAVANASEPYTKRELSAVQQLGELYGLALHRHRAHQARARLEAQLLHSQKMEAIGTLAGGIAHDFNNILTPILAHTDLMLMTQPPDSPLRSGLEDVRRAAERARDLVKQILAFGRLGQEERCPVRLQALVKETLKLLRASLPATIQIREEVDPGCGPVLASPTQIHQILMNLCTNARDAMGRTGGVLTVSLTPVELPANDGDPGLDLPAGSYAQLTVADTGAGIDPAAVGRIFDPYFTTKAPGQGSGLGLAVVHGIVTGHGGEIRVTSRPGHGSVFHVYLPETAPMDQEQVPASGEIPEGHEHVLLVDDEPSILEVAEQLLARAGYRVTTAAGGAEALERLRADPGGFDLLLTDQTMPGVTGADLAREARALRPTLPVLLSTGYSDLLDEDGARRLGARGLLEKPYSYRILATAVREALDGG